MLVTPQTQGAVHTQTDRVVVMLREMVLSGQFRPGERLAELTLAPLLHASRTPVRMGLERLAHQGLLEPLPKGGFRVREFTVSEVWDAIEVRGVLEGTAARLAAERLQSRDELQELSRSCHALEEILPMDMERFILYVDENVKFHREMLHLAKCVTLTHTLELVSSLPFAEPGALIFGDQEPSREAVERSAAVALEHHRAIIEAIGNREGTRAENLAREHARIARRRLDLALANRDLLGQMRGGSLITVGDNPGTEPAR
jgi:GntR family transcriptional regulator, vanillate catabolism transcriptional regulator